MATPFTEAVAREASHALIVHLVDIALSPSVVLHYSDRAITVAGVNYEDYVSNLDTLMESVAMADSRNVNADLVLRIKNAPVVYDGGKTLSKWCLLLDKFQVHGAKVTVSEVFCQSFERPDIQSVPRVLFVGAIDEPGSITATDVELRLSSWPAYVASLWRQVPIGSDAYPDCFDDLGRVEPFLVGGLNVVPTLKTGWGARTTLASAAAVGATILTVTDTTGFPSTGTLVVDDDTVTYTGITSTTFTGVSGVDLPHGPGADVHESKANYDCLVAGHLCGSLQRVYGEIGGVLYRITSGASKAEVGGKTFVRLSSQLGIKPLGNNLAVSDHQVTDALGVNDNIALTLPDRTVSQNSSNVANFFYGNPYTSAGFINMLFPAHGEQTNPTGIKITFAISVSVTLVNGYGSGNFRVRIGSSTGQIIADVQAKDGAIIVNGGSKTYSNWQSSVPLYVETKSSNSFVASIAVVGTQSGTVSGQQAAKAGGAFRTGTITKPMATLAGSLQQTYLFERIYVSSQGAVDNGSYGNAAGTLLQRPDHVLRWWLTLAGFTASEIDLPSFNAAGAALAAAGIALCGRVAERAHPLDVAYEMASNGNCALRWVRGKWMLGYLSSTIPAAKKTISKNDLAGGGALFQFSTTERLDVANQLTYYYARQYLPTKSEWYGNKTLTSVPAGWATIPGEIGFPWIKSEAVAGVVAAAKLARSRLPALLVNFPVFWEHADLDVGDTFAIENDFWNGRKFFVERIEKIDAFHARIFGRQWPGQA